MAAASDSPLFDSGSGIGVNHPPDFHRKFGVQGLTFDDVMLLPAASSVLPHESDTSTQFARLRSQDWAESASFIETSRPRIRPAKSTASSVLNPE